ncbi:peptidase M24 [Reticulibacter mediterranei]|uniref:Peptidase M24 n=1 Tax=Reticulibacter mediterranei TaxID=2778369 RepID=A0A8J3IFD2_9CHLR|nr:M24 family metallopeptidase [Reticulibacter mediterranei]GHO94334.1 peptidase M24 [Reticulibacter mediterranei]
MDIERVQQALQHEKLDGWLFYDFRKSNPIAYQVLELPAEEMYTRRWFYFVPAQGGPSALVSAVEPHVLQALPGQRFVFRTWQEMQAHLATILTPDTRVAMEYSPMNAIPYSARVDAGTLELVRQCGVEVVSSADLSQRFVAQLSDKQTEEHREAGRRLISAKDQLFAELSNDLRNGIALDEYHVQQRFLALIENAGLQATEPPIVGVNGNASNPHYAPSLTLSQPIQRGDLILFDFWARLPQPDAIYADYTWMAFAGTADEIPLRQREVFEIVRKARDTGIAFIRERLAAGKRVEGREVDDVTRAVIAKAGYGDNFVHRTGHSIYTTDHGNGANIDNYETQDARALLEHTCCSIEPGIYLPAFGIRSEVNLLIFEHDAEVTGVPAQEAIVPLL